MEHGEQLAWEARAGKPAAVCSFLAAVMAIAAGVYLPAALSNSESGADGLLQSADREPADFIVAGVLQGVGLLLLIPPLLYLFRAARYREPRLMPAAAILTVLGAVTLGVITMLRQLELIDIADGFVPGRGDVEEAAEDYIEDELSPAFQGIGLGGSIALAFGVVMIALNAMRAGLLSRFMGILGIFVGIVLVIPLGVQILQLFWFAALGLMFLDRWPAGRGPAWETGEAIPWPGAAEQREEIERRRAEQEQAEAPAPAPEPEPEPQPESAPEGERPTSRKRRKKKS
ncbi:MAG: DUF4386 family protein [Thermoleophilaceae bacterium]